MSKTLHGKMFERIDIQGVPKKHYRDLTSIFPAITWLMVLDVKIDQVIAEKIKVKSLFPFFWDTR